MHKEIILSKNAPAPIGPYSQAVRLGNLLFISGQIPINPDDGSIPEGIDAQTRQVLKNLSEVLKQTGSTAKNVLKTTIFLKDMNNFAAVNQIYGEFFSENPPARSTVEVSRIPKDVLVEIEAVAGVE